MIQIQRKFILQNIFFKFNIAFHLQYMMKKYKNNLKKERRIHYFLQLAYL